MSEQEIVIKAKYTKAQDHEWSADAEIESIISSELIYRFCPDPEEIVSRIMRQIRLVIPEHYNVKEE